MVGAEEHDDYCLMSCDKQKILGNAFKIGKPSTSFLIGIFINALYNIAFIIRKHMVIFQGVSINRAACHLAREVANEGNALVAGGVCQTPTYLSGIGKEATQAIFKQQLDVFVEEKVDFIICEYFEHVEEAEWAVEEALKTGLPVGCSLWLWTRRRSS